MLSAGELNRQRFQQERGRDMAAEKRYVLVERRGAAAKIIFNRPEKKNALSRDAIRDILAAFEELRVDDSIAVVRTTGFKTRPGNGPMRSPNRTRRH